MCGTLTVLEQHNKPHKLRHDPRMSLHKNKKSQMLQLKSNYGNIRCDTLTWPKQHNTMQTLCRHNPAERNLPNSVSWGAIGKVSCGTVTLIK